MFKLIFGTGPSLQILYNKNRVAASSWKKRTKALIFEFLPIIIKNDLKICQYLTSTYFTSRLFKHMEEQKTIGGIRFQNDLRHRRLKAPKSCN